MEPINVIVPNITTINFAERHFTNADDYIAQKENPNPKTTRFK